VPYLDDGPFAPGAVEGDGDEVQAFLESLPPRHFVDLYVDQVRICKPLLLPNVGARGKRLPCRAHYFEVDKEVYGSRLRVRGYFLAQSKAIKPSELRGVLVRVRGVGIGGYDKSFLDYSQWAAGPRLQQVTGELYIEEGLEDALNIDRNSFDEMRPHYLFLQRRLHDELTSIFKSLTADSKDRTNKEAGNRSKKRRRQIIARIAELSGRKYEIRKAPSSQEALVVIDRDSGQIFAKEGVGWTRARKKSELAVNLAIISAVAESEHPAEQAADSRLEMFLELLREVL